MRVVVPLQWKVLGRCKKWPIKHLHVSLAGYTAITIVPAPVPAQHYGYLVEMDAIAALRRS